jgi:hypothetical protein
MLVGTEGLWHDIELIALRFSFCNDLADSRLDIDLSGIGTRTAPSTLAGCEYTIDHVEPIEERIDNKHERV